MTDQTDVTAWCRSDLADLIRAFIRERDGEPVTALEADELADRLCDRVGLEVRLHLARQAWLFQNAPAAPHRLVGTSANPADDPSLDDGIPL